MKSLAISILFVMGLLLIEGSSARTMVLVGPRDPDFRLSLNVPHSDFAKLYIALLDFAHTNKMTIDFDNNPPRARGKQFFLSVARHDFSIGIIAEKAPGEILHIDCYGTTPDSDIYPVVTDLQNILHKNFPDIPLKVESHWLERNPPPPVHLMAPPSIHLVAPRIPGP